MGTPASPEPLSGVGTRVLFCIRFVTRLVQLKQDTRVRSRDHHLMKREDFLDTFLKKLYDVRGPVVTSAQLNAMADDLLWSRRMVRSIMTELITYQAVTRVRQGVYRLTCMEGSPFEGDLAEVAHRYPGAALDGLTAIMPSGALGDLPVIIAVPRSDEHIRSGFVRGRRVIVQREDLRLGYSVALDDLPEELRLRQGWPSAPIRVMTAEAAFLGWVRAHIALGGLRPHVEFLRQGSTCLNLDEIAEIARASCSPVLARRVGFMLRRVAGPDAPPPRAYGLKPRESRDCLPLDATRPHRGRRYSSWGIVDNLNLTKRARAVSADGLSL
jgi:hypothetical protein